MAIFTFPPLSVSLAGGATESTLLDVLTEAQNINTELDTQSASLSSIDGKDFATETTLDSLNTKIPSQGSALSAASLPVNIASDQVVPVSATNLDIRDLNESTDTVGSKIRFVQDGSVVDVLEDTVTPANNIPLPVKITSSTGDINITAGDLNVQLSHTGVNFDSTRIGDGTFTLDVNPDGSLNANIITPDLDIRNLDFTADKVDVTGSNVSVAGNLVSEDHDYLDITYVGATTDIDTVTYYSGGPGGMVVATLTMGYDGSNRLTSVTRT